jgi:hypothetical protein
MLLLKQIPVHKVTVPYRKYGIKSDIFANLIENTCKISKYLPEAMVPHRKIQ